MSLLLCRRERVKHPFYIEVLGIHIYSSQELCYVIYHHPLLVMNDFADASLFSFIKNEQRHYFHYHIQTRYIYLFSLFSLPVQPLP